MVVERRRRRRGVPPKRTGFLYEYLRTFRFYLVTGLLVWVPLIVTIWTTSWLFRRVGIGQENLVKSVYEWLNGLGERVEWLGFLREFHYQAGYGFLWALALFLTTGFFARNLIGRRMIASGERLLDRIPLISRIYRSVQQIRDVFIGREGAVFHRVCVVQYPRPGVYAVAFITNEEQGVVQEAIERDLIAVFLPTTPNPTSGFLLYLPPGDVQELDIGVEEAMKLIISGGAYLPGKDEDVDDEEEAGDAPVQSPST